MPHDHDRTLSSIRRRLLLRYGAAAAAFAPATGSAQRVFFGFRAPGSLFIGARFVGASATVQLWEGRGWHVRSADAPASPNLPISTDFPRRAARRTAETLARVVYETVSGPRARFAPTEDGPPDPTPEESVERSEVAAQIYLRDVTGDFPTPVPRGLRMLAVVISVEAERFSADPGRLVRWTSDPEFRVEAVSPRAAEDRVLELLEGALVGPFTMAARNRL